MMIQMIAKKPEREPRAKAENAEGNGIPKGHAGDEKRCQDAVETPHNGALMPRCLVPCLSRCGWKRDEVQQSGG